MCLFIDGVNKLLFSKAGFVPMQPDLWEVLQRMSIKPQAAKLLWITAKISRKEHIIIVIRYNNDRNDK